MEKHIIFSVQGQNDNLDELINGIIKVGCVEIVKMLNKIQSELEGTGGNGTVYWGIEEVVTDVRTVELVYLLI